VDVGNNFSVLEYNHISFVYDDIDALDPNRSVELGGEVVKDCSKEIQFSIWISFAGHQRFGHHLSCAPGLDKRVSRYQ
jgi:hypothetical protein